MEKEIKIKTEDNKIIYGTINSEDNETLAIFVHGLTGNQNEQLFYNAKKIFPKKGIDTFRFNLYDWQEDARKLSECDIFRHAKDVDLVIEHFKNKYEQIAIIGHSLGGPSILFSKQEVDAVILWDPSIEIYLEEDSKYIPEIKKYVTNWGIECLLSDEMINSCKQTSSDVLPNKFIRPTLIIYGSEGILEERWRKTNIKDNKLVDEVIIKGAGHCFDEENTAITLYAKTIEFIHEQTRE